MARFHVRALLLIAAAAVTLPGCSTLESVTPDRRPDYKKAKTNRSLEVPPDLNSETLDDSLVVPQQQRQPLILSDQQPAVSTPRAAPVGTTGVLPQPAGIELKRDGDQEWLLVQGDPAEVWPMVRQFWLKSGFLLDIEDPQIGIMETSWAENRADIPDDPIRKTLGKVLDPIYSAATRDRFRTRLERGEALGTTEIYLTHRGMEEVAVGSADAEQIIWKPRPSDPELEAEMTKRLLVSMGVQEQRADRLLASGSTAEQRAELIKTADGEVSLTVLEDFSRAWRRTGVALDRTGFAVEDRDRGEGIYLVRYVDPDRDKDGWFSKLFSGDEEDQDQFRIKLTADGSRTQVSIVDDAGNLDNSDTAKRILTLLHEQLR